MLLLVLNAVAAADAAADAAVDAGDAGILLLMLQAACDGVVGDAADAAAADATTAAILWPLQACKALQSTDALGFSVVL